MVDDKWGLDAPTKFAGQVLAAGVMALQGIADPVAARSAASLVLDPVTSRALTVLVVVLTVNAINFVDGLDGLAAGIVGIAALGLLRLLLPALASSTASTGPRSPRSISAVLVGHLRRASCRTTSTRRASSWATPARC